MLAAEDVAWVLRGTVLSSRPDRTLSILEDQVIGTLAASPLGRALSLALTILSCAMSPRFSRRQPGFYRAPRVGSQRRVEGGA